MAEHPRLNPTHLQIRARARLVPGAARLVWRGSGAGGRVALTFDDGPDPIGTPAVLEALAAAGAQATFFVLLEQARRHAAVLRAAVAGGHELGIHAEHHFRLDRVATARLAADLASWRSELEDLAGTSVRWHRPPYGRVSFRGLRAARRAGLDVVLWSLDPADWDHRADGPPASRVARMVADHLQPGGVVLLHDGAGDGEIGTQGRETALALGEALPALAARSLRPVRLSALG